MEKIWNGINEKQRKELIVSVYNSVKKNIYNFFIIFEK